MFETFEVDSAGLVARHLRRRTSGRAAKSTPNVNSRLLGRTPFRQQVFRHAGSSTDVSQDRLVKQLSKLGGGSSSSSDPPLRRSRSAQALFASSPLLCSPDSQTEQNTRPESTCSFHRVSVEEVATCLTSHAYSFVCSRSTQPRSSTSRSTARLLFSVRPSLCVVRRYFAALRILADPHFVTRSRLWVQPACAHRPRRALLPPPGLDGRSSISSKLRLQSPRDRQSIRRSTHWKSPSHIQIDQIRTSCENGRVGLNLLDCQQSLQTRLVSLPVRCSTTQRTKRVCNGSTTEPSRWEVIR